MKSALHVEAKAVGAGASPLTPKPATAANFVGRSGTQLPAKVLPMTVPPPKPRKAMAKPGSGMRRSAPPRRNPNLRGMERPVLAMRMTRQIAR